MPLRITCASCGKAFSAWDDLVGQSVKCPKCGQSMVVPASALEPTTRGSSSGKPAPVSPRTQPRRELPPPGKSPEAPRTVKVTPGPRPAPPSPAANRTPSAPRQGAAKLPPLPQEAVKPPAPVDTVPCPNCNAQMPLSDDLCDECGYHVVLRKVLDTSGVHRHNDATGFDRFLKGQLAENETAEGALLWAQCVAGFCLLLLCMLCLGLFRGFVIAAVIMGGYAAYRLATRQRREREEAAGNEDHVSRALWSAILVLQRAVGWRHSQWPFPKTRTLLMNAPDFDDDELGEWEGLDQFETLDLEGTRISDAGLEHLATLRKLRYLIVRGTRVTPAGVKHLQRRLRRTWIWF